MKNKNLKTIVFIVFVVLLLTFIFLLAYSDNVDPFICADRSSEANYFTTNRMLNILSTINFVLLMMAFVALVFLPQKLTFFKRKNNDIENHEKKEIAADKASE